MSPRGGPISQADLRRVPDDDLALEAFRHLCEMVHRPTQRRLEVAMAYDWSRYVRLRPVVADPSLTPARAKIEVRQFLEAAYAALADAHPSTHEALSGLDVVRIHLIEGLSWEAITAERMESGHPVSARTLRTRQREGLQAILAWAAEGDAPVETEKHATTAIPADASMRRGGRPGPLMAFALVVFLLVAATSVLRTQNNAPTTDPFRPQHVGTLVHLLPGAATLPAPLPPLALPRVGLPLTRVMVIPHEGAGHALVFTTNAGHEDPPTVLCFDPIGGNELWRYELELAPGEVQTHPGLPPNLHEHEFWPSELQYGDAALNLGDRIAVVHYSSFSPSVVTMLARQDGRELGRYVHPGRFETARVLDLDDDGTPELLYGGHENALDRAVLVLLDPRALDGAASSVQWKSGDPTEDALLRVVLPDVPSLRRALGEERFHVGSIAGNSWDRQRQVLTVPVRVVQGDETISVYQIRLGRDLRPIGDDAVFYGDTELRTWRQYGIDPVASSQLVRDIEFVGAWARP